jgi:hypothetical protein
LNRCVAVHPTHYTDHFRLMGLRQELGAWIDLDLIFLKSLPPDPYLMGWETDASVCNAVLRLPSDSAILNEYIDICQTRPLKLNVPWYPLRKRVKRQIKRATHTLQGKTLAPLLGPVTLTHLVRKHGLEGRVKPASVFYPVPFGRRSIEKIVDPGYIEDCVQPETIAVHLWRSMFRKLYGDKVPGHWLNSALTGVLDPRARQLSYASAVRHRSGDGEDVGGGHIVGDKSAQPLNA